MQLCNAGSKAGIAKDFCQHCSRVVEVVWTSATTRGCACCGGVLLDVQKEAEELQPMDFDAPGPQQQSLG